MSGALGTPEAVEIVPRVTERVKAGLDLRETVLFTRDTHEPAYLDTQEGRNLPVPHCIQGSDGWKLVPQLEPLAQGRQVLDKPTFGSTALGEGCAQTSA